MDVARNADLKRRKTLFSYSESSLDGDDLSDVVLPGEPVPIRYGLHELDNFKLVCKYNVRLGRPWNGDKLALLLDGLTKAKEAADLVRVAQEDGPLAVLKESVRELIRQGHSMTDIPEMLGLEHLEDAVLALCNGRVSAVMADWTISDWLSFESDIDKGVGATELSRTYDLSRTLVYRLKNLYDGKPGWQG